MKKAFLQSLRVLIVNDDIMQLMILTHLVSKVVGIPESHITNATTGAEAYQKASEDVLDIIFMDLNMPIMNGFETSQKIKDHCDLSNKK